MKTLGIFEVKNKLSEVCESIAAGGESVIVTRHGRPLVQIVPYVEPKAVDSVWGSVAECRARYGALEDEFELPPRNPQANRTDPLA